MNIKPIKEKNGLQKTWEFIRSKGYYVVLALCLTVVALLGYQMADSARTMSQETQRQLQASEIAEEADVPVAEEIPFIEAVEEEDEAEPLDVETKEPEPVLPDSGKVWPAEGAITKEFSGNSLLYSETLEEWRSHSGVDIASEMGTQVRAAQSGTVTEVVEGSEWGISITVDHGDGTVAKYMNLSTADLVAVGDVVEKGQVISGIGDTALTELSERPHLHFEVYEDGLAIDPTTWLPSPFSEE